ncbi:MAG: ribosome maturation factor RimP [Enhydrobacter sp.]|nr:ribosome maturation factor RimP [Enhydrobacter sp.]
MQSIVGKSLPAGTTAPIPAAILIGFAGRAKQKRVGRKPALFICRNPVGSKCRESPLVTEILRRIEDIVAPTIVGMGFELVRVAMSRGGGTLQVMIEPADGRPMDVEDCANVSRALSAVLDVEDPIPGAYTLEVSSPGIDRPLTREKDYVRWSGHLARMETSEPVEGRRRFKGVILGLENGAVRLRLEDSKEALVPLSIVSRAKLELTDALLDEHRRAREGAEQAH